MNKQRRIEIQALTNEIRKIGESGDLAKIKENAPSFSTRAEEIRDEEQDYFDNMPEGFQMGDKGSNAEEAISYLDNVISYLDDIKDLEELEGAQDAMEEAATELDNIQ